MRDRGARGAGHEGCVPLTPEDVPAADAEWQEIWSLARTFDGYGHLGNDACADLANTTRGHFFQGRGLPADLASLRSCLFFEHRRFRFLGDEPEDFDRIYVVALLSSIRRALGE